MSQTPLALIEGVEKLCKDLGVDPEDVRTFRFFLPMHGFLFHFCKTTSAMCMALQYKERSYYYYYYYSLACTWSSCPATIFCTFLQASLCNRTKQDIHVTFMDVSWFIFIFLPLQTVMPYSMEITSRNHGIFYFSWMEQRDGYGYGGIGSCNQESCLAPLSLKSLQTTLHSPFGGCSLLVTSVSKTSDISNSCFLTCSQSVVLKHHGPFLMYTVFQAHI